jgi:hypothetical protein
LRRRGLIWWHLRHGSPRGIGPVYQVPLRRGEKYASSRKSGLAENIFTFVPLWSHSA